jgi:hypothetical protein
MTKKKIIIVCALVLAGSTVNEGYSQSTSLGQKLSTTANVITTSVPSLLIGPDSRIGGMGETGVAVDKDINAQHWNPAKYVFSENPFGLGFSFSPWLAGLGVNDIYLAYLAGYAKVSKMDAISFSLRYFSMGDMEFTNIDGQIIGRYSPREFAIDAAYSRKLVENWSMAVTGRFVYSKLTNYTSYGDQTSIKAGITGAVDVSLFYNKDLRAERVESSHIAWGLCLSNIGGKVSYSTVSTVRSFLPANFRTGIAYTVGLDKYNKLTLAFDLNKLLVPTMPTWKRDSSGRIMLNPNNDPIIDKGGWKGKLPRDISPAEALLVSWVDAPGGFGEEMREFIENFGLEYDYSDLFFIRTGFFNEAKTKGNRKYITFGVGIKYSMFSIDASYILPVSRRNHPLENTLRFSLTFDFGTKKNNNPAPAPKK